MSNNPGGVGLTPAEASSIILYHVRTGNWRILLGDDALSIDRCDIMQSCIICRALSTSMQSALIIILSMDGRAHCLS
jgi:hypothetical protein